MRLTKAIGLGTATALAALLAAAPTASASAAAPGPGGGPDRPHHRVIDLDARLISQEWLLVDGKFAPGARSVFADNLFDEHGHWVGHDAGTCLITRVDHGGEAQCVNTVWLEGRGQLTVQGLVDNFLDQKRLEYVIAVTGGTFEFSHAHGQVEVERGSSRQHVELTFELELD